MVHLKLHSLSKILVGSRAPPKIAEAAAWRLGGKLFDLSRLTNDSSTVRLKSNCLQALRFFSSFLGRLSLYSAQFDTLKSWVHLFDNTPTFIAVFRPEEYKGI